MYVSDELSGVWEKLGIASADIAARKLPLFSEPDVLELIEVTRDGRDVKLAPAAAKAWTLLNTAAQQDSITLYLISGFRSIQRQTGLVQIRLDRGESIHEILKIIAPPGCSEHHTGHAVDVGTPGFAGLDEAFEASAAYQWLQENAGRFGFVLSFPRENQWGYVFEPWHWCYHSEYKTMV